MKRLIGKIFPNDMSPLVGILPLLENDEQNTIMNESLPQQVTLRYVSNLLSRGDNNDFKISSITYYPATQDGVEVGHYYEVILEKPMPERKAERACEVTPLKAVRHALKKFGVTFRR